MLGVFGAGDDNGACTPKIAGQPLIFEGGGTGRLAPGEGAPCLARGVCTVGTLNRLRYIQRNMITANVPTSTRLVAPTPRNTSTVQVSRGRQIAVLEAETH